jgi:hypothetical protein
MAQELVTGISATTTDTAQQTFVWNAVERNQQLKVTCSYGGGTATNNLSSVLIPWGSTAPLNLTQSPSNPAINAAGSIQVYWSADQTSYIVTFSGLMVQPNVNNILSSNMNGAPATAEPIIVAAYLSA